MLLKKRDHEISFLSDLSYINKSKGIDSKHPYILKLQKSSELTYHDKLSALSDTMFKAMFMNTKRKKYSCKLISYFLDISYEELLENLTFGKNELDKEKHSDKGQRADYVAYIGNSIINIEVNSSDNRKILERNLGYLDKLFAEKVKIGSDYEYVQYIQFNINNFAFVGIDGIKDSYYIKNENNIALSKNKIIINIYIPNLLKKWYNEGTEKLTEAERFLLVIILPNIEEAKRIGGDDTIMNEYIEEAIYVSHDDKITDIYDKERIICEGFYQDGVEEGITLGMSRGIEKVASKLKTAGFDVKMISANTGLSIDMIEKL